MVYTPSFNTGEAVDSASDDFFGKLCTIESSQTVDPSILVDELKRRYADRIVGELVIPPREARFAPLPADLAAPLANALRSRGVREIYSHQQAAWLAAQRGEHMVVTTPTASGKSLCYNLVVLDAIIKSGAKALYLFPTKALAQDQVAELLELNRIGNLGIRAYTFVGVTPGDARRAVRVHGDIVVSNPDMLHQAVLPHHTKWAQFFESLRYIVIDEVHMYRGVFGTHMVNLIRRLKRILAFYKAQPIFIMTSATIANARELAQTLIDAPVTGITESGAPQGAKHWLIWNPPVINPDLGLRASARSQSTRIPRLAVSLGLKTIVFANSRLEVEVLTKYLKDRFDRDPRQRARVAAYRGGYLPTERRDKEAKLRAGQIDCVVSTSALELGVDIGALDVCILNGYPGTVASALQRLGRAGRRQRTAVGILVASSDPLDQYVARNPEFFLSASPEHARVDPEQLLIQMDHLRCAAFELPFHRSERFSAESLEEQLGYLADHSVVHRDGDQWHWIADSYPANSVSLRSVAEGNFVVVDATAGGKKIIAEVDYSSAALTLYEGAIYMIQSVPWQIERLDWKGRKAYAVRTHVDYYTDAIDYTRLKILDAFDRDYGASHQAGHGEVHVVRRASGYKKIRYYTHENIGYGNINLPDHEMHTMALWWSLDEKQLLTVFPDRVTALDGFLGAAYALHQIATLVSLADRGDIGRSVGDGNGTWSAILSRDGRGSAHALNGQPLELNDARSFSPTVFLYDNYPGGMGLAAPLFDQRSELVTRALALIIGCGCSAGCPACVGPILRIRAQSAERSADITARIAATRVLHLLAPNNPVPAPIH